MWENVLLKNTPSKENHLVKYGLTNEYQSKYQIVDTMRTNKPGRLTGSFTDRTILFILRKLVRKGRAESTTSQGRTPMGRLTQVEVFRLPTEISKELNWKRMIDNIMKKSLGSHISSEYIYNKISEEYKFDPSHPTKSEINIYLTQNYEKHKIWDNMWRNK